MISALRPELGRFRFQPGLGLTLAALATLAVLVGLGTWQLQRLAWKEELIRERTAQLAAPPLELPAQAADWRAFDFRRIAVTGVFRHDLEQLFGVRTHEGQLGHHVLTPLVRPEGAAVLVDRGWIPSGRKDPGSRVSGQLPGQVSLAGIARYRAGDEASWLTPDNVPDQRLWYRYDLEALEAALGLHLLPVVVEADANPNPGGLPLGGRTLVDLPNNHLQYAVTWYGLALTLLAVFIAHGLKPARTRPR